MVRVPFLMVVHPSFPATTVAAFVAYAKSNPSTTNVGSPGNGSPSDLSGQLFKVMTGINMTRVTYRSNASAITDLLGGQIQVVFATTLAAIEYLKVGTLRALAVTTATRSDVVPNIPTMGEFLPGYEASGWWGIGAPRNTSVEIINMLNKEINAGLADPKLKARFADLGATVFHGSAADFGKLIADETEKWAKVIRAANIKPE
jgi:tripartite-type tricarboxylate transporter receptor subunit TctC